MSLSHLYSGATNVRGDQSSGATNVGESQSSVTAVRSNTVLTGKYGSSIMSEYHSLAKEGPRMSVHPPVLS